MVCLHAGGCCSKESLYHMVVLKLELGYNDAGVLEAGPEHSGPKGCAGEESCHDVDFELQVWSVYRASASDGKLNRAQNTSNQRLYISRQTRR